MRLLICAGGTGGGVYPALAVLQILKDRVERLTNAQLSVLWVGGEGGMEADLVKRAGVDFTAIPAAGVHGVGASALPGNLWQLSRGFLASREILRKFKPEVLFFTGGYVAVPMALAARFLAFGMPRPQSLLFVPDIEPGLALKTLARITNHITITSEDSRRFFPREQKESAQVTGYPVRTGMKSWSLEETRRVLKLDPGLPVLLVWGGSKGARSINQALSAALPNLLREIQVVHITGQLDWPDAQKVKAGLSPDAALRYHPYPYLHDEMGAALTVASLAITRAGASTLGELPLFGLPAILVPYPYAWRYQKVNADYLTSRGAAVMVEDGQLGEQLTPTVQELIHDETRLLQMRQAMLALAHPQAADMIADRLQELALGPARKGSEEWSA